MRYLAAYIRRANSQGSLPFITEDNWKDLAEAHATTSIPQKVTRLLGILGERSRPAKAVPFDLDMEAPLLDAPDAMETRFILDYLMARGDVKANSVPGPGGQTHLAYWLTVQGWSRLEPGPGGIPGRCFVAMSFHPSLNDAYQSGIHAALKTDCGLDLFRVDREEHNDRIDDRIILEIRRAQFAVADVTRQRQGVYFEAGFAMGLGRPVIWTCREDDFANVHFDTRQYNHVVWSTPDELRQKLCDRVRATIPGVRLSDSASHGGTP